MSTTRPADPEHGLQDSDAGRIASPTRPGRVSAATASTSSSERQAREQHIGRALDRLRHEPCPPALERRPRHDAVLNGKQPEQQGVDDQRRAERLRPRRCRWSSAPADCRRRRWRRGTRRGKSDRRSHRREQKRYRSWDVLLAALRVEDLNSSQRRPVDHPPAERAFMYNSVDRPSQWPNSLRHRLISEQTVWITSLLVEDA